MIVHRHYDNNTVLFLDSERSFGLYMAGPYSMIYIQVHTVGSNAMYRTSLVPSDSTERDRTVRYISFEPSDVWRLSILYGETKNKYSFHPQFIHKKAVKALDSALNQAHQITSLL